MDNQNRRRILPLPRRSDYLTSRERAKARGLRLASNVLHDDYLARSAEWKKIMKVYPAWTRELLVYPERGGEFRKGEDIADSETEWVLPAKYIPKEAIGRKEVGLFVDPEEITEERGRRIVHPVGAVVVLTPFLQLSGSGKLDESTRIALAIESGSDRETRWLHRTDGVGVRPLVRDYQTGEYYKQVVFASGEPWDAYGVAVELPPPWTSKGSRSDQKEAADEFNLRVPGNIQERSVLKRAILDFIGRMGAQSLQGVRDRPDQAAAEVARALVGAFSPEELRSIADNLLEGKKHE